jgi:hypothetical protein
VGDEHDGDDLTRKQNNRLCKEEEIHACAYILTKGACVMLAVHVEAT